MYAVVLQSSVFYIRLMLTVCYAHGVYIPSLAFYTGAQVKKYWDDLFVVRIIDQS